MTGNGDGWTENPSELLYFRVVVTMSDDLHDATKIGDLLGVTGREVGQVFDLLISQDLAGAFPRRLGHGYTHGAGLTATGKAMKSEWVAAQIPGRTKRACIAAMLSWLDAHEGESISGTDAFSKDVRAHYFGHPFNEATVIAAARELKEEGLISGSGTWGGPVLRPAITNLGKVVLTHHNGDLVAWEASKQSGGTHVSVNGSTGVTVAANSPGAAQVTTVVSSSEQVEKLAAWLEAMLPILRLDPVQLAEATRLVADLRGAAPAADSDPSKTKALVAGVKDVAVNATGGAAGSALFALAELVGSAL